MPEITNDEMAAILAAGVGTTRTSIRYSANSAAPITVGQDQSYLLSVTAVDSYELLETQDGFALQRTSGSGGYIKFSFDSEKINITSTFDANLYVYHFTGLSIIQPYLNSMPEDIKTEFCTLLIRKAGQFLGKDKIVQHLDKLPVDVLLTYFSYPVLMEIKSPAVVYNYYHHGRFILPAVGFREAFKELGINAKSIIKAAGEILTSGHDLRQLRFDPAIEAAMMTDVLDRYKESYKIVETYKGPDGMPTNVVLGDRRVNDVWGVTKFLMQVLPPEYVVKLLKLPEISPYLGGSFVSPTGDPELIQEYVVFLKRFSVKTRFALMLDPYLQNWKDIERQLKEFESPASIPDGLKATYPNGLRMPRRWKTLTELHDKVTADYREIKAESSNQHLHETYKKLPYHSKLHNMQIEHMRLVLPQETKELVHWGHTLKNCISSYADRAVAGTCVLVGVMVDDQIKYAMEMSPSVVEVDFDSTTDKIYFAGLVTQFVGDHNKAVPVADRLLVFKALDSLFSIDKTP
jgi:hypothetical protein